MPDEVGKESTDVLKVKEERISKSELWQRLLLGQ